MAEMWRPCPRPFRRYQVSSLGRVRGPRGVMTATTCSNGYRVVCLTQDLGPYKTVRVCRLVAAAFHGEAPAAGLVVRRKNADPGDDRTSNLYWGSAYRGGSRDSSCGWTVRREPGLSEAARFLLERGYGLHRTAVALNVKQHTLWKKAKEKGFKMGPRGRPRRGK